ncbi:secondary thiamine-phosphate synthase enzyme [Allomyces macrogynus ATCC 38327]|uniref:Secondary thiamine-phosphate synthase enzyme n=1 Tax=Allomyces macrogynus (strain ATCC 38327) TaxID=578462 RepID=A0A0L0SMG9_ALLM3|nr:secondary thiamine-phosphate synthase enzyme [Allomyces macrogynus ATCC 38327]|eukprot:KNE63569.1 secondary thiamine-phosphate synthase enzyme [Allomyces macrogynus ATCC 38327]
MAWVQRKVTLSARSRGCHLVTDEIVRAIQPDLRKFKVGLANIFIQHTSASLTINENCDPDVRRDMEMMLNRIAPESAPYTHTDEGADDMPAHVKTTLVGPSLTIPISNGNLALGTWQGIWLCEHRDHGGSRRIVVTLQGQP